MKKLEITRIFTEMADILEFKGDNPFKIRAYRRAALNIGRLSREVEELSGAELREIPGIGEELAAKITQYLDTGTVQAHERLKEEVPAGILDLLGVPGLGARIVRLLYERQGIVSLDSLEQAASEHRLAGLPGIPQKTEENILKGIARLKGKG